MRPFQKEEKIATKFEKSWGKVGKKTVKGNSENEFEKNKKQSQKKIGGKSNKLGKTRIKKN